MFVLFRHLVMIIVDAFMDSPITGKIPVMGLGRRRRRRVAGLMSYLRAQATKPIGEGAPFVR